MRARWAPSTLVVLIAAGLLPALKPGSTHRVAAGLLPIALETVASNAATGDGGNFWGGHQTRIVRTNDGVFTAYTVDTDAPLHREWRLAWRRPDGTWPVVARGEAGREPVNLLASPDGTLHVIGWPDGKGMIWSGKPHNHTLEMTASPIPGVRQGNWPYNSAGIDLAGNLCVLASDGGQVPGGSFTWACRAAASGSWVSRTTSLDYRFCYTYLFPDSGRGLSLVSTRDVRWEALGYAQPKGAFAYVFNAFGYWRAADLARDSLQRVYLQEEPPTTAFPWVFLNAQQDAYLDTVGRMHVLYWVQGASTNGTRISRHLILSPSGQVVRDVPLPADLGGGYARIFQDAEGRFYIISSTGRLYPAGHDGLTLEAPLSLDLQGTTVEYSGFGLSVPRTGTPISDTVDVVFPSDSGRKWIYFRLTLPGT